MPIERQLSVFVQNKVGSLADLCASLAQDGVNIKALSIVDDLEWGIVRLILDNPEQGKKTLQQLGLMFGESNVLTIEMENHPGVLAELASTLSRKKINIEHAYLTAAGDRSLIVMATTDDRKALQTLKA